MNITLTPDQLKTLLDALSLSEDQINRKKEMRDLSQEIHRQLQQPSEPEIKHAFTVRKQILIGMEGGVIQSIHSNFKDTGQVVLWDNDDPDKIRESFAIPEGMQLAEYWDKVIVHQYPYEVKF